MSRRTSSTRPPAGSARSGTPAANPRGGSPSADATAATAATPASSVVSPSPGSGQRGSREPDSGLAGSPSGRNASRAAAVGLVLQGLFIVALGALLVVRGFGAGIDDRGRAELGGVLAVGCGLAVLLFARAVLLRRRWARSPVVLLELLSIPVAVGLVQGDRYDVGLPLIVIAVAVPVLIGLAGAFTPPEPNEPPPGRS